MLKFKPFNAPKEFKFVDPDTGFQYKAQRREALVKHIISYRIQNRLPPIEFLDAVLENYWCGLYENSGACKEVPLKRGILETIKGGIKLLTQYAYNKYAPQVEADRRSDICIKCKYNVFPDKKGFIKWGDMVAAQTVGERRSKNHTKLGNCEVCTCLLKAKVFYEGTLDVPPDQLKKMREVNCWQPALVK